MISILIPFKNTAAFLNQCLDSILAQTYVNWQIVAINDHSNDNSLSIVESYAKKDSRIQVYTNSENGIIPALRLAYQKSTGEFITRMDSDDIMKPNRLEFMVEALKTKGKKHVAIGQVQYFSQRGISDGYSRYEKWLNSLTALGSNYTEIYKECVIPSPCWMVHKDDFEACDAFKPNRYPEDYDLTFRFYEHGLKIIPCNQVLLLWRDYDTRTSRTHEHYAQNYFLDIKLYYFLKLEYKTSRELVVWGAGFKGKKIAKELISKEVDFIWLCDNPNKIDKEIYGLNMFHFSKIESLRNPQSIITVANENAQLEIKTYLNGLGQKAARDFYFFC